MYVFKDQVLCGPSSCGQSLGRAGELDSGGYCIRVVRKMMVALRRSGGEGEEGLGFICRWN